MPHTKSKGQTRARGTTIPNQKATRRVATGGTSAARAREGELPLRGTHSVLARTRRQSERDYIGGSSSEMRVVRGKRFSALNAGTMDRKARNAGRRPTKVAASTRKPRSKLGRAVVWEQSP